MRSVETGSLGCFLWLVHQVFWGLLVHGRGALGPHWTQRLALHWPTRRWGARLLPGGPSRSRLLLAVVVIVLVLGVLGGVLRVAWCRSATGSTTPWPIRGGTSRGSSTSCGGSTRSASATCGGSCWKRSGSTRAAG